MTHFLKWSVFFILLFLPGFIFADVLRVGVYEFAPFAKEKCKKGIVIDFLEYVRSQEPNLEYELFITNSHRRQRDLLGRKYDIIFFEDLSWSWEPYGEKIRWGEPIKLGDELFAMRADKKIFEGKIQDNLQGRRVRIHQGYHYNFLGNEKDLKQLRKNNISAGLSDEDNFKDLLAGRVDIVAVNSFWVKERRRTHPYDFEGIILDNIDNQSYKLRVIWHPEIEDQAQKMQAHLKQFLKLRGN